MAKRKQKPTIFGYGKPADPKAVLAGIETLQERLSAEFEDAYLTGAHEEECEKNIRDSISDQQWMAAKWSAAKCRVQPVLRKSRTFVLERLVVPDYFDKIAPFVGEGSVASAVRVPPYDYEWAWEWKRIYGAEGPEVATEATQDNGTLHFRVDSNDANHETASAAAVAVGIYFRPESVGTVFTSSRLHYIGSGHTSRVFASVRANAWVGVWIGVYRASDGKFVGSVVSQRDYIFHFHNEQGLFLPWKGGYDKIVGATFPVSPDHYYGIWTWAGGYQHAQGDRFLHGSQSHARLDVTVPFINWTFLR